VIPLASSRPEHGTGRRVAQEHGGQRPGISGSRTARAAS